MLSPKIESPSMNKLHLVPLGLLFFTLNCFATTISFEVAPVASKETNFSPVSKLSDYSIKGAGVVWDDGADHANGVYTTTTETRVNNYGDKIKVPGYMKITIKDKNYPQQHAALFTLSLVGIIGSTPRYQLVPISQKGLCIIASVKKENFTTRNCFDSGPTNLDDFPLLKDDKISIIIRPT